MPGPSWPTVLAAVFTAAFFLLLTVKLVIPAVVCGVVAVSAVIWWLWSTDPGPTRPPVDIGAGIKLPVYATGPVSHSWWGMVVLLLVVGTIFVSLTFSYYFLWTVNAGRWPPESVARPDTASFAVALAFYAAASVAMAVASRRLRQSRPNALLWLLPIGLVLALAAWGLDLKAHLETGLRPDASAYGAVVYTFIGIQGVCLATTAIMGLYTVARRIAGMIDRERRATFDNSMLFWQYTMSQGIAALVFVHISPRLLG
jgi:cytochrome c oxidase subunit I+III